MNSPRKAATDFVAGGWEPGIAPSVLSHIGRTPLVALDRYCLGLAGRILAKLEYYSPGGSKKDRVALAMIERAEAEGRLKRGDWIVEVTSGNTGTGLAIACAVKGYRFIAVMSKGNSRERALMMEAFGAEVVLVDQVAGSEPGRVSGPDLDAVEITAREIEKERGAYRVDQFSDTGNVAAYEKLAALEIIEQSGGAFEGFCDFAGTGGTFIGCARAFKQFDPSIQCYLVEPESAPALSGKPVTNPGHPIQGGGYSRRDLPLVDREFVDGYLTVNGSEATETARRLAGEEGILGGFSGGANVAAATKLLAGPLRGGTIIVFICDTGMKYLSTNLWSPEGSGDDY